MLWRLLRRIFGRRGGQRGGPRKPAGFVLALAETLAGAGHRASIATADAPEHALAGMLDTRSHGLLSIEGGPPDLVLVSGASQSGHLADTRVTGFHWLIRRDGLAASWPDGLVEAKREFHASDVGPARRFRWTAADESAATRAAAAALNELGAANDGILQLLRDPGTLVIEVAPQPELGLLRLSHFVGNRNTLERPDVVQIVRVCEAIGRMADQPSAPEDG
jgi:hypothetical protein